MAGQPTADAIAWASVVFPDPAGPLTMTSVGSAAILAVIAECRNVPGEFRDGGQPQLLIFMSSG